MRPQDHSLSPGPLLARSRSQHGTEWGGSSSPRGWDCSAGAGIQQGQSHRSPVGRTGLLRAPVLPPSLPTSPRLTRTSEVPCPDPPSSRGFARAAASLTPDGAGTVSKHPQHVPSTSPACPGHPGGRSADARPHPHLLWVPGGTPAAAHSGDTLCSLGRVPGATPQTAGAAAGLTCSWGSAQRGGQAVDTTAQR